MSIVTEAMTANLHVGIWVGHRLDKEASRKVTQDNAADDDAARVNKHIVPKESLKPIITASGALRTHFYHMTLPWKDNGDRLLTRKMYLQFIQENAQLTTAFNDAVEHFLDRTYPSAVAAAEFRMGALFKLEDYPTADALRRKFYVNLDIDAVSEAGDFRVKMDANSLTQVQADMTAAMEERLGKAMKEVWVRLATAIGNFKDRMAGDGMFKSATLTNLEELVEMLPAMNILNDPDLDQIAKDIKGVLNGVDAKDLRKDDRLRAQMAKDAQEIVDTMGGFMKAFG